MFEWGILTNLFDAIAVSIILISIHFYVESFLNHKSNKNTEKAKE